MKLMMGAFYYRVIFHALLSKSHLEPSASKEDPFLKPPVRTLSPPVCFSTHEAATCS